MGIIAGVDDAGRGSVLGPLVIAAVSADEGKISTLVGMGVKDSKLLAPKKRKFLCRRILNLADGVSVWRINPKKIDRVVLNGERLFKLNYLEARYMALALSRVEFDAAYVDCCDTDQERFGRLVGDFLRRLINGRDSEGKEERNRRRSSRKIEQLTINSEHHADKNYPIVSAASIVAKVARDSFIERLCRIHGAFGSGYPSDKETIDFLGKFLERTESLPPIARLSWDTIRRLE